MLDLNQHANGTDGQLVEVLDEFARRNPDEDRERLADALQTTNPFIATAKVTDTTLGQWLEDAQSEYENEIISSGAKLIDVLAENLSIYAGNPSRDFRPEAIDILKQFRAAFRRDPTEYTEIETFFHERQLGKHLKGVP